MLIVQVIKIHSLIRIYYLVKMKVKSYTTVAEINADIDAEEDD